MASLHTPDPSDRQITTADVIQTALALGYYWDAEGLTNAPPVSSPITVQPCAICARPVCLHGNRATRATVRQTYCSKQHQRIGTAHQRQARRAATRRPA